MRSPLLIVGAGGHAQACVDVVEAGGVYRIAGLVGLPKEKGTQVLGHQVIGDDRELPKLVKKYGKCLVAIGQIKSPQSRIRVFHRLLRMGGDLPIILSPRAYVSAKAQLGLGSIVMHGATLQAGVRVGKNCIINDHALLDHGVQTGSHCHVSTGAILNEGSFIGSGSVIMERVVIPPYSIIPMGTIVRNRKNS